MSVVSITRNNLAGLRKTADSVLGQSLQGFEWIVVDGASTDGTVEWLQTLTDERVNWTSEPDSGIYDAMNDGLERSTGALVWFLNSGDCFASQDVLEAVVESHDEQGWRWMYGGMRYVQPDGTPIRDRLPQSFRRWEVELGIRFLPHPASVFDRELLLQVGSYDLAMGMAADQDLMLRCSDVATPHVMRKVLADFEMGGVSTVAPPDRFVRDACKIRRAHSRPFLGSTVADSAATEVLALAMQARRNLSRWRPNGRS